MGQTFHLTVHGYKHYNMPAGCSAVRNHFFLSLFHWTFIKSPQRLDASPQVVKVKIKVTLRPTISRPVRLGIRRPSGTRYQFFYLLEIFLKTVTVRYVVAPSLTRGRVCNLM
jgi:hypothetical protein